MRTLLILLLPLSAFCQTFSDSTIIKKTGVTEYIRFLTTYESAVGNPNDSLVTITSGRRRALVSPLQLPVSTAQAAVNSTKQPTLVNATNIKSINGSSILGSGDLVVGGADPTKLAIANNLSDVANITTAKTNLSLQNVTNESKATMFTNATFTGTFDVANGSIANSDLANGAVANLSGTNTGDNATNTQYSGLAASKQNVITVLPFANGGISGAAATSATTGTMTVNMTSSIITITPTGACTFNASGGVAGQVVTFAVTTSGVTSFVLTFGTNFRKVGTLATGTTSARFFSVTFRCIDGTIWQEIGRTAAQT